MTACEGVRTECVSADPEIAGSVYGNKLHDFAVACTNSSTILLFSGQKDGRLHLSSFDVRAAVSGGPAEPGILMADLLGRGGDDIIVSNGSAGTVTILFFK